MDRPSDCRVHQPLVAIVILHFVLNTFIFANGVFIRHICCVQSFYILQWRKWCKRVQRYQRRDLWLRTVCDLIILRLGEL